MPGRRGGGREPGGGRRRRGRPLSALGEAGAGRRRPSSSSSWSCRARGPRRHLLRLLPLLLLLPAGAEGQAGPSSGPHAAGPPDWPPAGPGPSFSLYLSEEEVRRLIGECGPGPSVGWGPGGRDGGLWGWGGWRGLWDWGGVGGPGAQKGMKGVLWGWGGSLGVWKTMGEVCRTGVGMVGVSGTGGPGWWLWGSRRQRGCLWDCCEEGKSGGVGEDGEGCDQG